LEPPSKLNSCRRTTTPHRARELRSQTGNVCIDHHYQYQYTNVPNLQGLTPSPALACEPPGLMGVNTDRHAGRYSDNAMQHSHWCMSVCLAGLSVAHQFQVRARSKPCLVSSQGVAVKGAVVRGCYGGGSSSEPLTGRHKALQQTAGGSRAYGLGGVLPMLQPAGARSAAFCSPLCGAIWCVKRQSR